MDIELPLEFKEFLSLLNDKGVPVNIISLRHLKINKKASGRYIALPLGVTIGR